MNERINERIKITLGDGADSYYVYMLCDRSNHKPFYIGKGKGGRVWQHEESVDEINRAISELENNMLSDKITQSEKISLEKELSLLLKEKESFTTEKTNRIETLKASGNLEKVIVKWGLTEHESFMVESALINMYLFINNTSIEEQNSEGPCKNNVLTNIVNGHMSTREKENISHETKARSISEFLKECAIEQYSICNIKSNVEFVFIGDTWQECKDKFKDDESKQREAIKDCACAAWPMHDKVYELSDQIDYVFALYKSQVVGTYRLCKKPVRRCELSKDYIENHFPKEPEQTRRTEKTYTKHCSKLSSLSEAEALCKKTDNELSIESLYNVVGIDTKTKDKEKAFQNWKNRVFFILEEIELPEFKDKKLLLIPTTSNPNDLSKSRKFNVGDIRNFTIVNKKLVPKEPITYSKLQK